MQKTIIPFLLLFLGCNGATDEKESIGETLRTNSKAQILHGIIVHETEGLEVSRAFLSHDDGVFVNSNNTVHVGDTICLNLVFKQGWMAEHGKVSIGATQNITTESGEPVLSSPDLFAGNPEMEQAKATQLQLKTTLTKARPDARRFFVHYRIWDKIGPGEVSGSYRLQLAGDSAR